jgi:8-oxo-dGTP pyrophosphatase MutT (NUDIX family)
VRERLTARVVLLDPADRVLLMKGRLPSRPQGPGAWFTLGGGAEPGESVLEAALREVREETGFLEVTFGPVLWLREGVMRLADDEEVLMKEHYVLARCPGGEPSRAGWDANERRLIDDIRWWTHGDLAATSDRVFPSGFAGLLSEALTGPLPAEPRPIAWP